MSDTSKCPLCGSADRCECASGWYACQGCGLPVDAFYRVEAIRAALAEKDEWWRSACIKFALVELGEVDAAAKVADVITPEHRERFGGTASMIIGALGQSFRKHTEKLREENERLKQKLALAEVNRGF